MSKNIFRTKSINQFLSETKQDGGMNRVLGTFGLTMLGIGCIVGTGIFVLTGIAAANYSGPALVISFIIAALACGCAALCYSEFAAMIPVAGSAYTYGYVALGEFWAWVIGWDLILEYTLALSAVSIGWSGYFGNILTNLGLALPKEFITAPEEGGLINLPAMAIIWIITLINMKGITQSSLVNDIIVVIKLAVVGLFIASASATSNRPTGRRSCLMAGPVSSQALRSSSLLTSASTPSRRLLKKSRTRRKICLGASSYRSSSARFSTLPYRPS